MIEQQKLVQRLELDYLTYLFIESITDWRHQPMRRQPIFPA